MFLKSGLAEAKSSRPTSVKLARKSVLDDCSVLDDADVVVGFKNWSKYVESNSSVNFF